MKGRLGENNEQRHAKLSWPPLLLSGFFSNFLHHFYVVVLSASERADAAAKLLSPRRTKGIRYPPTLSSIDSLGKSRATRCRPRAANEAASFVALFLANSTCCSSSFVKEARFHQSLLDSEKKEKCTRGTKTKNKDVLRLANRRRATKGGLCFFRVLIFSSGQAQLFTSL